MSDQERVERILFSSDIKLLMTSDIPKQIFSRRTRRPENGTLGRVPMEAF